MLETSADIGLAFDGDADRVFLIDELGSPLSGSATTAIVATDIGERTAASVIHNLICSKSVKETVLTKAVLQSETGWGIPTSKADGRNRRRLCR